MIRLTLCLIIMVMAAGVYGEAVNTKIVKLAAGSSFRVSGYDSETDNIFAVGDILTIDKIVLPKPGSFNRIFIEYTSDKPLTADISYKQYDNKQLKTVTEQFFLEKGTSVFGAVIKGYVRGQKAASLKSISLSSLDGSGIVSIKKIGTETIPVLNDDTCFIANEYLKVGIRLRWGGGINYIEALDRKIEGLGNLINQADTGRLIQQSYYGDKAAENYEAGEFNGQKWCYNPVQGGDKYNNHSRLIDVSLNDNRLYIKAQPQDWSLNGKLTPSYMENKYSLEDRLLRVDNRFTDYSGQLHSRRSQEVPAFYVVSYLDRYVCYQGDKPWTGDTLTVCDNLPFWGEYHPECSFPISDNNSESWSAWISSRDDFGIGLYTPGVSSLFSGRFGYNGSKDSKNGATNYTAPVFITTLRAFEPLEYSYLITAGKTEEIRKTFEEHKDFVKNFSGYQ